MNTIIIIFNITIFVTICFIYHAVKPISCILTCIPSPQLNRDSCYKTNYKKEIAPTLKYTVEAPCMITCIPVRGVYALLNTSTYIRATGITCTHTSIHP